MLTKCQEAISRKLKNLRASGNLKQREVAAETGIGERYYQDIEGGRVNMTLNTLLKLSQFFRVKLAELLSDC